MSATLEPPTSTSRIWSSSSTSCCATRSYPLLRPPAADVLTVTRSEPAISMSAHLTPTRMAEESAKRTCGAVHGIRTPLALLHSCIRRRRGVISSHFGTYIKSVSIRAAPRHTETRTEDKYRKNKPLNAPETLCPPPTKFSSSSCTPSGCVPCSCAPTPRRCRCRCRRFLRRHQNTPNAAATTTAPVLAAPAAAAPPAPIVPVPVPVPEFDGSEEPAWGDPGTPVTVV